MESTPEGVEKFRKIFKKEYGKELTLEEAKESASNLLGFFELLIEIDRRNEKEKSSD